MRLGLFGGTFNPVHNGHVRLCRELRAQLSLDKIIIMPANIPPHKSKKIFAGADARYNMCRLAFPGDFYEVSRLEIDRGGRSFSVDTIFEIKKIYGENELFLLVGSDMLFYFDKWVRYEEILKMCTLCAVSREKGEDYAAMRAFARDVLKDYDDRIIITRTEAYEISSTEIRERRSKGADIGGYVPEGVKDYIESRGLYLEQG